MSGTDGNIAQRAANTAAGLAGDAKKTVGQVIGNERMQAEGHQERAKVDAKNEASAQKQNAGGAFDKMKGNVQEGVGKLFGNESKQAEGQLNQAQGQANKDASHVL